MGLTTSAVTLAALPLVLSVTVSATTFAECGGTETLGRDTRFVPESIAINTSTDTVTVTCSADPSRSFSLRCLGSAQLWFPTDASELCPCTCVQRTLDSSKFLNFFGSGMTLGGATACNQSIGVNTGGGSCAHLCVDDFTGDRCASRKCRGDSDCTVQSITRAVTGSAVCNATTGACQCSDPNRLAPECETCRTGYFRDSENLRALCRQCQCANSGAIGPFSCDPSGGRCLCKPGFIGDTCDRVAADCGNRNNCTQNGLCVGDGTCECFAAFSGSDCGTACANENSGDACEVAVDNVNGVCLRLDVNTFAEARRDALVGFMLRNFTRCARALSMEMREQERLLIDTEIREAFGIRQEDQRAVSTVRLLDTGARCRLNEPRASTATNVNVTVTVSFVSLQSDAAVGRTAFQASGALSLLQQLSNSTSNSSSVLGRMSNIRALTRAQFDELVRRADEQAGLQASDDTNDILLWTGFALLVLLALICAVCLYMRRLTGKEEEWSYASESFETTVVAQVPINATDEEIERAIEDAKQTKQKELMQQEASIVGSAPAPLAGTTQAPAPIPAARPPIQTKKRRLPFQKQKKQKTQMTKQKTKQKTKVKKRRVAKKRKKKI
ncbi:MAG: hypothetical protein MHM6MM_005570 [Cercozoa sp. M6MM]